jgi:GMP synthase (glutamine-hydrolysing)
MNVALFHHTLANDSGTIGRVLERFGASCTYVPVAISDLSVFDPLEPDLLVVLGGAPGVYQSNDYPFLKEEVRILEKRLAHDKPTLGICLGAQLMAAALGASNFKGQQGSERGWSDIQITPEGQNSPVAVFDHSKTKVMQWHQDTFDLPDGATLLATGDVYRNQIFSWGKNALGFQCHIEVSAEIIHQGLAVRLAHEVAAGRLDLAKLRKETAEHLPTLVTQTEIFLQNWFKQIGLI